MSSAKRPELRSATPVVLGMLALGARTGYEIKSFVDISVRHFWTISYGQIYPELKRLESEGLVEVVEADGRRRRTTYQLTRAGHKRLLDWLTQDRGAGFELRDELLLKLFFSDDIPTDAAVRLLERMRARHQSALAGLLQTEKAARHDTHRFPYLVLRFGIDFHRWALTWCDQAQQSLTPAGGHD